MAGIPDSSFFQDLVRINALEQKHFQQWLFQPGMLFRTMEKWWDREGERQHPHEGLDICSFLTKNGQIIHLNEQTKVSGLYNGIVAHIQKDFLGFSCFIRHPGLRSTSRELLSVLGHIVPENKISRGGTVQEGEIIGTLADTRRKETALLPHLHLSLAWIDAGLPNDSLNWKTMNDPHQVTLLDPLAMLPGRFSVMF